MSSLSQLYSNGHANILRHLILIVICSSSLQFVYGQVINKNENSRQQSTPSNVQVNGDATLTTWENKKKYFLVVAANKTASSETDLPFAKVDGTKISETLHKLGYVQLATLPDKRATLNNFVANLKKLRELPANSLVVVYYSGHGAVDPQGDDLWLQLYGQDKVGWGLGLSLSNLIKMTRSNGYKGDLAVIIDACYSGQGTLSSALTLRDLGINTTILTSSSEIQESYSINVDKIEMSAFTHFLSEGLTDGWDTADDNHDGIVQYEELRLYIKNKLNNLYTQGIIEGKMTPYLVSPQAEMIAAYNPAKVKNPNTLVRIALEQELSLSRANINQTGILQNNQIFSPPVPSVRARELAQLIPNDADNYSLGLKAIAEGRYGEAKNLLKEAATVADNDSDKSKIYQAYAEAEIYDGNFQEGSKWLKQALQISSTENVGLIEEAAFAMMLVSNIADAEALSNQARIIRHKTAKESYTGIFILGSINLAKGSFDQAESYFQQLQKIDGRDFNEKESFVSTAPIMLANLYFARDKNVEAEKLLRDILAEPKNKSGSDDPVRGLSLLTLAAIYIDQNKTSEGMALSKQFISQWGKAVTAGDIGQVGAYVAYISQFPSSSLTFLFNDADFEAICQRSNKLLEKEFNTNSTVIALSLVNLSSVYKAQGKYDYAQSSLNAAGEALKNTIGNSSAMYAMVQVALGDLYLSRRKFSDAERVLNEALITFSNSFGPQSINVIYVKDKLTDIYMAEQRYQQAEVELNQVADGIKYNIGTNNPKYISTLEHLSQLKYMQQQFSLAEELLNQALAIKQNLYGPNHDEVADTFIRLAEYYYWQGIFDKAEEYFGKALNIYDSNGGHAYNLPKALFGLGLLAARVSKVEKAKVYFTRSIDAGEKILGPNAPDFSFVLQVAADFYLGANDQKQAIALYEHALSIREKVFGLDNPAVAETLINLGVIYCYQNNYAEGNTRLMRAQKIWEQISGPPDNKNVVRSYLSGTMKFNIDRGNFTKAESIVQCSLSLDEKVKQSKQSNIANDQANLGMLYYYQGEHAKAEASFLMTVNIQEHSTEVNKIDALRAYIGLALIYQEQSKVEMSESFRTRIFEILKSSPFVQKDIIDYLENRATLLSKFNRPVESAGLGNFAKAIKEQLKNDHTR